MGQVRFSKKVVAGVLIFIAFITVWFFYIIMSKDLSTQICDLLKHIYTLIIGISTAELGMLWKAKQDENKMLHFVTGLTTVETNEQPKEDIIENAETYTSTQ